MSSSKPDSPAQTTTPEPAPQDKSASPFEQAATLVLHQILLAIAGPHLRPANLGRLASATATLTRSNAYAQTAKLHRKHLRAKIAKLTPPPEEDFYSPENLEKLRARVRAIYGIDWDFNNPPSWDAEEPDNFPGLNAAPQSQSPNPTHSVPGHEGRRADTIGDAACSPRRDAAANLQTRPHTSIFPPPHIPDSYTPSPIPGLHPARNTATDVPPNPTQ